MRADGFVVDGVFDAGNGRGRRSTYLDVPATAGHVTGISLGVQTTCVLATDQRGREVEYVIVSTPDEDEVGRVAAWLVAQPAASTTGPLRQIVTAVPGRGPERTEIHGPADSRQIFTGCGLRRALEDLVDAPVLLDSAAIASLLAILTEDAAIGNAVLFIVSTALNFASCTDHEIAQGRTPAFGDLGVLRSGV